MIEISPMSSKPRRIVIPFPLDDFRPLPFTANPHVQTVLGAYWNGTKLRNPTRPQVLPLPDGDALMIYDNVPDGWQDGDRIVLLIHGLTGSHASPQNQRMGAQLLAKGARVVRMDHRGTAGGLPLARYSYHAGRSEDVRAVVAELHRWAPLSPIAVHGTSLGGNMAAKLAGEVADDPLPGLDRISALNPPLDMAACCVLLSHRNNRHYDRHFAHYMVKDAEARFRHFPDVPVVRFPKNLSSHQFDELYTAPWHGFADAADYHVRSSAAPLVERSPVPLLLLTARDDPFVDVRTFEALRVPDHVQVVIVPKGGHIGYLGSDGVGGVRWAEHRLVEWLTAPLIG
jgi:predicted alpha/beta-fold hydrolase